MSCKGVQPRLDELEKKLEFLIKLVKVLDHRTISLVRLR